MKTSIIAVALTFGLIGAVHAGHPGDVGPESLFYDYDTNHMKQLTASDTIIQRDKGVMYVKTKMDYDSMLDNDHTDIVPSALLY